MGCINILGSLDEKIENNERISLRLEQFARLTYNLFIKNKMPNATLSDLIIENLKSKIQVGEAKKQSGKYPFFTSGENILSFNEWAVDGKNIFLNTGGLADIKYYIGKANYSTDTWCIKAKDNLTDYLYLLLLSIKNEINLMFFEGSALKHLQKSKLKTLPIYLPTQKNINEFNKVIISLFEVININLQRNKKLNELKQLYLKKFFG